MHEAQPILPVLDCLQNFPERSEGAHRVDHTLSEGDDLGRECRWRVLIILEGNGPEDGFQGGIAVFWDDEVMIVMAKLLAKSGLLVDIARTD